MTWNPDEYRISRRKMVEAQLVGRGIKDGRLLDAMGRLPRHLFVDEALAAQSYSDAALPIGFGQTISQPYMVALMVESLRLSPGDKVLEVGFGSGYQTAILASLAREVYGVERLGPLFQRGRDNLARLGFQNIHLKLADGTLGWPEAAPFNAIAVAAGGPQVPGPLTAQLAEGGRLIVPVGPTEKAQELTLVTKGPRGAITSTPLGACRFVALIGQHGW